MITDKSYNTEDFNAEVSIAALAAGDEPAAEFLFDPARLEVRFFPDFFWNPYGLSNRRPELFDSVEREQQRKTLMIERGVLKYWQQFGFPPQCRPLRKDDFECNVAVGSIR